jgi:hypothetical protein
MAFIGPTPEALRYAIKMRLPHLEKELRYSMLGTENIFFDNLTFTKSKLPRCFGTINLSFYVGLKLNKLTADLSTSELPIVNIYAEEEFDMALIETPRKILNRWSEHNVAYIPLI